MISSPQKTQPTFFSPVYFKFLNATVGQLDSDFLCGADSVKFVVQMQKTSPARMIASSWMSGTRGENRATETPPKGVVAGGSNLSVIS